MRLGSVLGRHWGGQERPKSGQERPKSGQERPKIGPRAAKTSKKRPESDQKWAMSGKEYEEYLLVGLGGDRFSKRIFFENMRRKHTYQTLKKTNNVFKRRFPFTAGQVYCCGSGAVHIS